MIAGLNIVIFGAASLHNKEGFMPSIEDANGAVQLAEDNKRDLAIYIVDENLNYAVRLAADQPSFRTEFTGKDAARIKGYNDRIKCYVNPPWEIDTALPFIEGGINIKNSPNPVIYLSYVDTSSYEIMNSIGSYELNNRWFLTSKTRISLTELIGDYLSLKEGRGTKFLLPDTLYDLYSGDVLDRELYDYDIKEVKKQLNLACIIIDEYFKAGFNTGENKMDVLGFSLNSETTFIKGICFSYGLLTNIPDKTNFIELRTNSSFRKQLWNLIARVLSNFAINNKLITIQEAVQYGGWNDQRVYILIRSRLPNMQYKEFITPPPMEEKENIQPIPPLKVPSLEEIFGSNGVTLPPAVKASSSSSGREEVTLHIPETVQEEIGSDVGEFSGED